MTVSIRSRRKKHAAAPTQWDEPGEALLDKATELIFDRQWRASTKTLQAAKRLRPDDLDVDELLAVSAAHARQHRVRDETLRRLSMAGDRPTYWTAIAAARLASNDFENADRSARKALEIDPNAIGGWNAMAAGYAGLGWFDEAQVCLDRAEQAEVEVHGEASGLNPLERWQLGRAINRWATTTTHTLLLAVVAVLFFRLLGAAIVITAPLAMREYRVRRLDENLRAIANEAWAHDHRTRLLRGLALLSLVLAWLGLLVLTQ